MIDLADVQGIIRSAYNHKPYSRFLFLRIERADAARAWLRRTIPEIRTAEHWHKEGQLTIKPQTSAHVGFTWAGLGAMGLPEDALLTFPREFQEGMANANRSEALGDIGPNDPALWEVGGPNKPEAHLLLMLYAVSSELLDALTVRLWNPSDPASGLKEIFRQDSWRRDANEPFGFLDGVSQPAIEGVTHRVRPGQDTLKTGEFVLGYENEYGQMAAAPTIGAAYDPNNHLPDGDDGRKEFGRNGSFLVWRKLKQDVEGFWRFLDEQTKNPDGTSNAEMQRYLGAKLIGRWPSGAPLTLAPEKDDPALGADKQRNNNFLFMPNDEYGYRCPVGSHMRRANPRDTLKPNPKESQVISRRHRIMRRGRPYGLASNGEQPSEQGLLFIAVQANLERQFEFIQQTWLNSPKFQGLYDSKDPLLGNVGGGGTMDIQRCPARKQIQGLPQFVTVKGGAYFFLPSLSALRFLADDNSFPGEAR